MNAGDERRFSFRAMGSPCEVVVAGLSDTAAAAIAQRIQAEVARLEARYSRFRDDSDLSRINRIAAVGGEVELDAESIALMDYAATCYAESDGLFDITSGVLREAWRFDGGTLPNASQLAGLGERIGFQRLEWQRPWLRFPQPGLALDFGGIVKEYAADRCAALAVDAGADSGFINLGGDVRVLGPRANGAAWTVGVRHPRRADDAVAEVALAGGAIATSGDYERCLVIDGRRYGHVLNPRTGWPVTHLASVSVVADLCVVAGSAATIAMLHEANGPAWLAALGLPHLWVDVDGQVGGTLVDEMPAG